MIEFGEKLKRAREEKGMTQQTLAEQLFVTRQAVSRWECGARYPELLMAKRISDVLDTSLDDMLSGEEMKTSVEKQPVVENPLIKNIQVSLYACIVFAFVLNGVNAIMQFPAIKNMALWPEFRAVVERYSAMEWILSVNIVLNNCFTVAVFIYGFVLAVKDSLTPRKTGYVIVFYLISYCLTIGVLTVATIPIPGMIGRLFVNVVPYLIGCVAAFIYFGKKSAANGWCYCLWGVSIYGIVMSIYNGVVIAKTTALSADFNMTVNMPFGIPVGVTLRICIFLLSIYQSYVLRQKRRRAYDINK